MKFWLFEISRQAEYWGIMVLNLVIFLFKVDRWNKRLAKTLLQDDSTENFWLDFGCFNPIFSHGFNHCLVEAQ